MNKWIVKLPGNRQVSIVEWSENDFTVELQQVRPLRKLDTLESKEFNNYYDVDEYVKEMM